MDRDPTGQGAGPQATTAELRLAARSHALLDPPPGRYAWQAWRTTWRATPGPHGWSAAPPTPPVTCSR